MEKVKKSRLLIVLMLILALCAGTMLAAVLLPTSTTTASAATPPTITAAQYAEGANSSQGCDYYFESGKRFEIYTAKGAAYWTANQTAHLATPAYLMNDIDIGDFIWVPFGTEASPFKKSFYGQGHTVSNIYINVPKLDTTTTYVGFFGHAANAKIQDLGLVGGSITVDGGNNYGVFCGGLTGYGAGIYNCFSTTTITNNNKGMFSAIGGIVGAGFNIYNCYSASTLTLSASSSGRLGGIAGMLNNYNTIYNCRWLSSVLEGVGKESYDKTSNKTITNKDTLLTDLNVNRTIDSKAYQSWKIEPAVNNGYPILVELHTIASVTFDDATTVYPDFVSAWTAATDKTTADNKKAIIKLLRNSSTAIDVTNTNDFLVLDTNSFTLTFTQISQTSRITNNGGSLNIVGTGTISGKVGSSEILGIILLNDGTVSNTNATIENSGGIGGWGGESTVVIKHGTFNLFSGTISSTEYPFGLEPYKPTDGTVNLYSGTIKGASQTGIVFCKNINIMPSGNPLIFINSSTIIDAMRILPFNFQNETEFTDFANVNFNYVNITSIQYGADGNNLTIKADKVFDGTVNKSGYVKMATTAKPVTITFESNGGSSVETQSIVEGNVVKRPTDPTKNGYTFGGWYTDNNSFNNAWNFATDTVTAATTLYAKWTANEYSITYNLDGGTATGSNPPKYTIETNGFTLSNPTREGYVFNGWTGTGISGNSTAVTVARGSTGDRVYTATWAKIVVSVTFNSTTNFYADFTAAWNAATACSTTAASKATIALLGNISTTICVVNTNDFLVLDTNSFTLTFQNRTAQSKITNDDGTLEIFGTGTITGEVVSSTPEDRSNAAIVMVKKGKVSQTDATIINTSTSQSYVTAVSTSAPGCVYNFFSGTLDTRGGSSTIRNVGIFNLYSGTIKGSSETIIWSDTFSNEIVCNIMPSAVPLIFINRYATSSTIFSSLGTTKLDRVDITSLKYGANADGSNLKTGSLFDWSVNQAKYVTMTTTLKKLFVSFETYGGSVIDKYETYYGGLITKPTDPIKPGHTFSGWYKANTFNKLWDFDADTATAATTLYAKWTVNNYTIVFDRNGGTGSMPNQSFTYGVSQLLNTHVDKITKGHYNFASWNTQADGKGTTINDGVIASTIDTANNATVTLYAQWTARNYSIDYNLDGGTLAEDKANPGGYTIESETFTLNNPTKEGFIFLGWSLPFNDPHTEVIIKKGSTGYKSYTARWLQIVVSVTFDNKTIIYDDFVAAWNAATAFNTTENNKATIKLLDNTTTLSNVVNDDDYLVLDTNGFTLTFPYANTENNENSNMVNTSGSLQIIGKGAIKGATVFSDSKSVVHIKGGTVSLTDATIFNPGENHSISVLVDGGTFNLFSGTVKSGADTAIYGNKEGTANLHSGTIQVSGRYAIFGVTCYIMPSDKPLIFINGASDKKIFDNLTTVKFDKADIRLLQYGANTDGTNLTTATEFDSTVNSAKYVIMTTMARLPRYDVTFDSLGGTEVDSQSIKEDSLVTKPTTDPTRLGYTFDGWYKEQACANAWNFSTDTVTVATTLYAKWTVTDYSIKYNLDSGTATGSNPTSYTMTTPGFTLSNPTRVSYIFTGWTGTGITGSSMEVTIANGSTGDRVYTATWAVHTVSVTFDGEITYYADFTSAWNAATAHNTTAGSKATITLLGNTSTGANVVNTNDYLILQTQIFNLTFTQLDNDTSRIINNGGTLDIFGSGIISGSITYANARAIIQINDGTVSLTGATISNTKSMAVYAVGGTFNLFSGKMTTNNAPTIDGFGGIINLHSGTITGNGSAVVGYSCNILRGLDGGLILINEASGKSIFPYATTPKFDKVNIGSIQYSNYLTGNPYDRTSNFTETVNNARHVTIFTKVKQYNVTFNYGETITRQVDVDSLASPPDITVRGYTLEGWYKDTDFTKVWDFAVDTVTGNINLYAKLNAISYRITYNLDGGTATGEYPTSYTIEDRIYLTNPTKDGYIFSGWERPDSSELIDSIFIMGDTGDKEYIAHWAKAVVRVEFYNYPPVEFANFTDAWNEAISNNTIASVKAKITLLANTSTDVDVVNDSDFLVLDTNGFTLTFTQTGRDTSRITNKGGSLDIIGSGTISGITDQFNFGIAIVCVNGGTVSLKDATIINTGTNICVVTVHIPLADATFNLYNGTLQANGTAALLSSRGICNLYGGTIKGKTFGMITGSFNIMPSNKPLIFTNSSTSESTKIFDSLESVKFDKSDIDVLKYGANADNLTTKADNVFDDTVNSAKYVIMTTIARLPRYDVTFESNGGNTISAQSIKQGSKVIKPDDPTKRGHTFVGWYKESNFATVWDFNNETVSSTIKLYAQWTVNNYTVTFDAGGGTGSMQDQNFTYGTAQKLHTNAFAKTGYTFDCWLYNGITYDDSADASTLDTTNNANVTFVAKWTANTYTITYHLDGGTATGNPTSYTVEDKAFILSNPTKAGYVFAGWVGTDITDSSMSVTIAQGSTLDRVYTATWENSVASVTFDKTTTEYGSFSDAWTYANSLTTNPPKQAIITLYKDVSSDFLTISGKHFVIDLNGKTLSYSGTLGSFITLEQASSLEIKDSANGSSGVLSAKEGVAIKNNSGCTLTISGGTVSATNKTINNDGTITITGGTVLTTGTTSSNVAIGNSGTVTVNGGTVSADFGKAIFSSVGGSVNVISGTISASSGTAIEAFSANCFVTISGGTVSTGSGIAINNFGSVTISGGIVSADSGIAINNKRDGTIIISGSAIVTSANPNQKDGTIYLSNGSTTITVLDIQGGTVNNTAGNWAVYNEGSVYGGITIAKGATVGKVGPTWSISYNANGGTGGALPDTYSIYKGFTASHIVSGNTFTRIGYNFNGYNTRADGNGTSYAISDNITSLTSNITLFAQWAEKQVVTIDKVAQTFTYDGSAKPFAVHSTPGNLIGFTVEYYVDGAYTTNAPTNVGSYKVKITRAEDGDYNAFTLEIDGGLVIDKASIIISGITSENKTYDGKTDATLNFNGAVFFGKIVSDNLTITANGAFQNSNAVAGKIVNISGLTLGGTSVGNYILAIVGQQKTTTATINKANYTNITHNGFTGTYDPNKTLADYELNSNFRWENTDIIPTVDVTTYKAIYNADSVNYNDFELEITVTLAKANYANITHEGFTGTYDPNKTLAQFTLKQYYTWKISTTTPTVDVTTYKAIYNADSVNYNDFELEITVTLVKANYTGFTHDGFTGTYDPNKTLADYELNSNFCWENSATKPTVDVTIYKAIYNADSINYNDFALDIVITLDKAEYDMSGITFAGKSIKENQAIIALAISGNLPRGVTVTYLNNSNMNPGIYTVTAQFNGDATNYNLIGNLKATLTILKVELAESLPENETGNPDVVVGSEDGLDPNITLVVKEIPQKDLIADSMKNKVLEKAYNVTLYSNGVSINPDGKITIKLLLPTTLSGKNLNILHQGTAVTYKIENGYAVFTTESLGDFVIVTDQGSLVWLIILLSLLLVAEVGLGVYKTLKDKKAKKSVKTYSFAGLLLAAVIPTSQVASVIVIGSLCVAAGGYLLYIFVIKDKLKKQVAEVAATEPSVTEEIAIETAVTYIVASEPTVTNEVAIKSAVTEVAPIVTNVPNVLTEVDEEEKEVFKGIEKHSGLAILVRYHKSFTAKLIQSPDETKNYYTQLKNAIMSYAKVKSRISWSYDSINLGKRQLAKFNVKGKTLYLYLALNADDYIDTKYKVEKVDSKKYENVPCLYKIKKEHRARYALDLIATLAEKFSLEFGEVQSENYYLPFETTEALVAKGLIKELITKEKYEEYLRRRNQAELDKNKREFVSASEVSKLLSDEVASALLEREMPKSFAAHITSPADGKRGIINVDILSQHFETGETVTLKKLKEKKLLPQNIERYKVLARGSLNKPLTVIANEFSLDAIKMIILTGGKATKSL